MAMIGKVKRMHFREKKSVREIVRLTSLSRNTVRKWLKASVQEEPRYRRCEAPGKLTPFRDAIKLALKVDAHRPRHERRTARALHAQIKAEGCAGSYSRVTDFVRAWRQGEGQSVSTNAFVPLTFELGEAFQFDWSEEGLVVGGICYQMQVLHLKLCASRAFWLVAYLRAAFGLAMRAGLDPTLPEALTAFDIQSNPADRLPSLAQFSKALDRALTLPELHAFWRRVDASADSPARDALIACMYLGGQRPTQLLRATPQLVDVSGAALTLLDPKGRDRHANPRRHVLPIHEDLMSVIRMRLAQTQGVESPLFSTAGRVPLRKEIVAALVEDIEKEMQAAGELERGPFSMRDLRRTAETQMAALGISSDVRAQIQSHGLGDIQARHYDRHDYMPEKRTALTLWAQRFRGL